MFLTRKYFEFEIIQAHSLNNCAWDKRWARHLLAVVLGTKFLPVTDSKHSLLNVTRQSLLHGYLARALVLTDVLPPFFYVEWTVAQSTGDEEQLSEKYTHVSIFKISDKYYLLWSLSSIIVNLSKLYMKIIKHNPDSVSFNIYEERNQRYLILRSV